MSEIGLEVKGDSSKGVGELIKLARAGADVSKELQKAVAAGKATEKELAAMDRAAERLKRSVETPFEKFNRDVAHASQLLNAGKISTEDYGRAVDAAKKRMEEAGETGRKTFAGRIKDAMVSVSSSALAAVASIALVKQALQEVEQVGQEAAARARESRIDIGSLAQVANSPDEMQDLTKKAKDLYAAGAVRSEQEGAQVVFSLQSAGQMDQYETFKAMGKVGLVADLPGMARSTKTLQTAMGVEETGTSRDLVNKAFAVSAFSPAKAEAILEASAKAGPGARALKLRDEEVLAATAVASAATGTADEGGTLIKGLMTSLTKIGAGEIPGTVADPAAKARLDAERDAVRRTIQAQVLDDPEYKKGMLSIEAQRKRITGQRPGDSLKREKLQLQEEELKRTVEGRLESSPEYASKLRDLQAQEKALPKLLADGRAVPKFKFEGTNLAGMMGQIQDAKLTKDQEIALFGSEEGLKGYRILQANLSDYVSATNAADQAAKADPLRKKLGYTRTIPSVAAATTADVSKQRQLASREELGTASNIADAIQDDQEARQRRSGWNEVAIWAVRKMDSFMRKTTLGKGDTGWIRENLQYGGPETRAAAQRFLDAEDAKLLKDTVSDMRQSAAAMKEAATTMRESSQSRNATMPRTLGRPDRETGMD